MDIHIGDTLFVEKGGEIIPKIVGKDISKRLAGAEKPLFPEYCPDCSTKLEKNEGEAKGLKVYYPPLSLCTDNAAMIAGSAYFQYNKGDFASLDLNAYASLSSL